MLHGIQTAVLMASEYLWGEDDDDATVKRPLLKKEAKTTTAYLLSSDMKSADAKQTKAVTSYGTGNSKKPADFVDQKDFALQTFKLIKTLRSSTMLALQKGEGGSDFLQTMVKQTESGRAEMKRYLSLLRDSEKYQDGDFFTTELLNDLCKLLGLPMDETFTVNPALVLTFSAIVHVGPTKLQRIRDKIDELVSQAEAVIKNARDIQAATLTATTPLPTLTNKF